MIRHYWTPNIVLLLTDQHRHDAVGYVNPLVTTPHLDQLAAQSVNCTQAIVQSPQCQPSRASIFTGRYPTAHKVWWNGIAIPESERTLGNYLQAAGYHTGYFGKLHFDGQNGHAATAQHFGFANTFLYEDWGQSFAVQYANNKNHGLSLVEQEFHAPMDTETWTGRLTRTNLHHEEVITARALEFIATAQRPYFCVLGFHGPHPPYAAPDDFSGLYRVADMPVPNRCVPNHAGHVLSALEWQQLKVQYYGSVSWIDACIGRVLAALDYNTIVVFTADHGDILGEHGLFSKGLFAYDGVIRVPLLIKAPGLSPRTYSALFQSIDIVPTILDLCHLARPPGLQGRSLSQQWAGLANQWALSMIGYQSRLRMLRTSRYKYWIMDGQEWTFDLQVDPGELVNLGGAADLRYQLLRALIGAEDPLPIPIE